MSAKHREVCFYFTRHTTPLMCVHSVETNSATMEPLLRPLLIMKRGQLCIYIHSIYKSQELGGQWCYEPLHDCEISFYRTFYNKC